MKQLNVTDLTALNLGSTLLGSGGGGDASYMQLMAHYQLEKFGAVSLISIDELSPDDLVVPLGMIGAPLITQERILSGKELKALIKTIEERLLRRPTVLMAGEIGGANAFTPLLIAAELGLPLLDGDLIGRAFPALQMNACHLHQHPPTPAVMADAMGNTVLLETPCTATLERLARGLTVSMGSSAVIALHLMDGKQAQDYVISGTVSQALQLGRMLQSPNPIDSLQAEAGAVLLAKGSIVDIEQDIRDGFLWGAATLNTEEGTVKVLFKNEYLIVNQGERTIAATPDIIMFVEDNSGIPITSEMIKYGQRVSLITLPAPLLWKTEAGLQLVGPNICL